jgi:hypothetical protein
MRWALLQGGRRRGHHGLEEEEGAAVARKKRGAPWPRGRGAGGGGLGVEFPRGNAAAWRKRRSKPIHLNTEG